MHPSRMVAEPLRLVISGIDHAEQAVVVLFAVTVPGHIHHTDPECDTDLRGSHADRTGSVMHRIHQILNQVMDAPVDLLDPMAELLQDRMRIA